MAHLLSHDNPEKCHELFLDNQKIPALRSLLEDNAFNTIDAYANLRHLSLNNCQLHSLNGFPKFQRLQKLDLGDNRLTGGLDALQNLPALVSLDLSNNRIADTNALAPLAKLPSLRILNLLECDLTKIGPTYPEAVFKLLPQLSAVDDKDREGNEVEFGSDSDEEEEEGDDEYDEDGSDHEEDEGQQSHRQLKPSTPAARFEDEDEEDEGDEEDYQDQSRPPVQRAGAGKQRYPASAPNGQYTGTAGDEDDVFDDEDDQVDEPSAPPSLAPDDDADDVFDSDPEAEERAQSLNHQEGEELDDLDEEEDLDEDVASEEELNEDEDIAASEEDIDENDEEGNLNSDDEEEVEEENEGQEEDDEQEAEEEEEEEEEEDVVDANGRPVNGGKGLPSSSIAAVEGGGGGGTDDDDLLLQDPGSWAALGSDELSHDQLDPSDFAFGDPGGMLPQQTSDGNFNTFAFDQSNGGLGLPDLDPTAYGDFTGVPIDDSTFNFGEDELNALASSTTKRKRDDDGSLDELVHV
ncbi:hypothetical protein DFJ77DRAFT_455415 [Powellomyces hirtus]|nr:hypothetical protein DFJ77DRAFT_455415 [Powellomyces hirtus]